MCIRDSWLYFWCGIGYGTLPAGCPLLEMIQYDAFQSVHPSNPGYEDKPCVPGQGSEDFAYRCVNTAAVFIVFGHNLINRFQFPFLWF